ncbi:eukaryotic translation initiation factor 3 subunit G-like [Hibiscus syriacus]|uniref:eukaryotic translation initiation factor 3 subunit G-like n=1 Tax=Hibiscus syriacus TaxID=106335 RepID=UPI001922FEB5|nr:eukaryotic translation initiation factor 3 subunit G-like [Hibiscus syriacus]
MSSGERSSSMITLFVSNLPPNLHWGSLRYVFGRQGDVVDSFIARKVDRFGNRFGFVRFSNIEDAYRAIERLDGLKLYGLRIHVNLASFKGRKSYWKRESIRPGGSLNPEG